MSWLRQTPLLFLFLFVVSALFSFSQGSSNHDHLQHSNASEFGGEGEFRRVLEETSNKSTTLILAADRTHRRDPLNGFNYYTGGWSLDNHYFSSVAFSAVPLFGIAAIWLIVFGLYLCCTCLLRCCCCCGRQKKPYGYSRTAYAISLSLLVLFTVAAIAGSVFLYTGQEKFQESQVTVLSYVLKQADTVVQNLRNVFNYLMGAKKIGEGQAYFSPDLQAQIGDMQRNINDLADNLRNVTGKSSGDIRKYIQPLGVILIYVAAAMLLLASLGFLLSILGLQGLLYFLVVIAWIAVVVTFTLSGIFLLVHNAVADTCVAMDEWLQNPTTDSALENIIPRADPESAEAILKGTRGVTFALVNATNTAIVNIYNINMPPEAGPLYSNQSGPLMPLLCNPFDSNLTNQQCAPGEVEFSNATEVWKNYICNVSATGICTTPGRVTPNIYDQLTGSLNVSYGLYQYGPFLVDFVDSTYLKETFSGISKNCCPSMKKSTKWMYTGFTVVSVSVMLSLILWMVFARERRQRKYTKKHMAGPNGMNGYYR
ncbi:hypothetical protein RHSIM_Rhsim09G0014400 [Rhododendron simsii]|uniref:Uncharacterized protein n=1 Tax=Rhododendron simsii TaxID=118357 RepID=A0A834GLF7_RHOSS|nr:hypothetical protein RHSIM_Rhsim09G0014400 [Rhododendron simsii]